MTRARANGLDPQEGQREGGGNNGGGGGGGGALVWESIEDVPWKVEDFCLVSS